MKKLLFILFLFVSFQSMGQRFPSIDSLQAYILKYFRNSTVETFTNLRGQNIVYGTTEFLEDIVSGSGVDSIWIVDGGADADTLRYRRWSVTYTAGLISGGGGGGSGTVTSFAFTNSTGITGTVLNPTTTPTLSLVIDSGAIANFSAKVRSLVSATYPIQYTSGTGVFNLDTSAGKWRSENYYDTKYALIGGGGGSTSLKNAASGYRLAIEGTDSVKVLQAGTGIALDSSTYGKVIISATNVDSSAARVRTGTYAQRAAIVSPQNGDIFTQTDRLAGLWEHDGYTWNFIGAPLKFSHYEQFANATINVPRISGLSGGTGATGTIAEAVGISSYAVISTGTTNTGYSSYGFPTSTGTTLVVDSMIQYQEHRIRIPVLGTAGENFNVAVGWLGHQNTWTFGTALFWYNYNSGGGVWQTFTRKYDNSGNMTYKVSAVTVAANQWYKLGILMDGYSQTVEFYIDDVLVTTHSTAGGDNIPIPNSTVSNQYNFGIAKSAGTTARTIEVDYSLLYMVKRQHQ